VPGLTVPEAILERMRRTGTAEAAAAEGVAIAREVATALVPMVQGLQIATPTGRLPLALDVLDGLDLP